MVSLLASLRDSAEAVVKVLNPLVVHMITATITVVSSLSAVQAQLEQNPNHQAHMIQKTQVMRVLWKVVQAPTTEVMGVASDVEEEATGHKDVLTADL